MVHKEMKLAIKTDLRWLWTRLPHPDKLRSQLREMILAEERAKRYGVDDIPWRNAQWYGIDVPTTLQEVDNSAIMTTRTTGKRAGRQKENRK